MACTVRITKHMHEHMHERSKRWAIGRCEAAAVGLLDNCSTIRQKRICGGSGEGVWRARSHIKSSN